VDIYPDEASYQAQFRLLVSRVPETALVVADASLPVVRRIVREEAKCEVAFYALDGDDTGDETPSWLGAPVGRAVASEDGEAQSFDLFGGGVSAGRFVLPAPGLHNARNALAAIAAAAHGFGANPTDLKRALATFGGVKRRQDLLGTEAGVRVYDDFAHHPTAVGETLRALRSKHPQGALWAVFEPRSATACRKMHQDAYAGAFDAADHILVAPLGRTNVPEDERLDIKKLTDDLGARGKDAALVADVAAIVSTIAERAHGGDTVAILSNGAFGGVHLKLLTALAARSAT
jgi:UDP-N-acetylmuramate: L-alanyl-gamma-D-glutamyl-meso-diaminopimelate ligase